MASRSKGITVESSDDTTKMSKGMKHQEHAGAAQGCTKAAEARSFQHGTALEIEKAPAKGA